MRIFDNLYSYQTQFPGKVLYRYKKDGVWHDVSIESVIARSGELARGLYAAGVRPGEKVGLIANNRPEWNLVDYACQFLGAVSVPIYPTLTPDDMAFIFQDAGVRVVFASSGELARKSRTASEGIAGFLGVWTFDPDPDFPFWEALTEAGSAVPAETTEKTAAAVKGEDLLTLIYTSGTTGRPKGVMLTHNNLFSNVQASGVCFPLTADSTALSFLPLCHIYERMLSYLYIRIGITVAYAESMDTIGDNLKEIKPHLFCTVPRLLEKVYDKIVAKGQELRGIKRFLFFWALDLGQRYELNTDQGAWYRFQLGLANKIIFNKWRDALGGQVRFIVSGGAALQPRLARVFSAARIVVMEGYGLTETSPVIAVNRYEEENRRIGTVGPVLEGVEVKIAPDGEILTRGPHIMQGYYNRPDITAETIDGEGWLHTGDIGEWVEGKFLKITDRKKEMFKTSGGKYIAPQMIENKLKESLVIEQAMVIGDGMKFPAAILVPSPDGLRKWCELKEIPWTGMEEMITLPRIREKFDREVEKANASLAQYEKIKKNLVVAGPWGIDTGELTPSLKLRRKVILARYQKEADNLYASA